MKRFAILFIALGGWVLTTGCAHQPIIEAETLPSKKGYMELVGTGHQLVKRGTIDLTQQFAMPDQVMIEAWVLRAKTGETGETEIGEDKHACWNTEPAEAGEENIKESKKRGGRAKGGQ